jgi:hypothetical protein
VQSIIEVHPTSNQTSRGLGEETMIKRPEITYVNITNDYPKYKGCLNLFIGDYCIALVDDVPAADQIRAITRERQESDWKET